MHKDRALASRRRFAPSPGPGELTFQRLDRLGKIIRQMMDVLRRQEFPRPLVIVLWKEMRRMDSSGVPLRIDLEGSHHVETQESQIRQVIVIEPIGVQVRVDEAESAQAVPGLPVCAEIGEK